MTMCEFAPVFACMYIYYMYNKCKGEDSNTHFGYNLTNTFLYRLHEGSHALYILMQVNRSINKRNTSI